MSMHDVSGSEWADSALVASFCPCSIILRDCGVYSVENGEIG